MSWKNILKVEDTLNMGLHDFGNKLINALEALGFEIKYGDYYQVGESKFKEFTTLTEEELEWYDGSFGEEKFGHELVITDIEPPYAYGDGFGTDTLTIKYLPSVWNKYHKPSAPDHPQLAINAFKIIELEMTTERGKQKIDVKLPSKTFDNSSGGLRDMVKEILDIFKENAKYVEDYGDMSERELREMRGEDAGHRYAGAMRGLGYEDR